MAKPKYRFSNNDQVSEIDVSLHFGGLTRFKRSQFKFDCISTQDFPSTSSTNDDLNILLTDRDSDIAEFSQLHRNRAVPILIEPERLDEYVSVFRGIGDMIYRSGMMCIDFSDIRNTLDSIQAKDHTAIMVNSQDLISDVEKECLCRECWFTRGVIVGFSKPNASLEEFSTIGDLVERFCDEETPVVFGDVYTSDNIISRFWLLGS